VVFPWVETHGFADTLPSGVGNNVVVFPWVETHGFADILPSGVH